MSFTRRSPAPRGAGQLFASVAAVAILLLSLAMPVGANEGPTKLYDAGASPSSGTSGTTITFTVGYRNREGSGPAFVRVLIDGTAHEMAGTGDDWKHGEVYHFSTTLPVGAHAFSFAASDTRKFTDEDPGGTVTISAPPPPPPTPKPVATPAPTPKPVATPAPTPAATPRPAVTPTPKPASTAAPTPTHDQTPSSTATPDATPTADPPVSGVDPRATPGSTPALGAGDPGPTGTAAPGLGQDPGGPAVQPDPSAAASGEPIVTALGPTSGGDNGSSGDGATGGAVEPPAAGVGWGAMMAAISALGLDDGTPHLGLLPTLVGTSGAVAMGMAFAIFGKKRRDEAQPVPDDVLKAQAARGSDAVASAELTGSRPFGQRLEGEDAMPRWRRPSLLEARKADPARSVAMTSSRLAFAADAEGDARERRVIKYRVVTLLDAPDELRSSGIGQLDQGDEVQLLERSGAYWLVLCPDGRQGWLHKMTLGEIVDDAASLTAAEAWGAAEPPTDILQMILDARSRA